jgi:hypothetical protein
MHHNAFSVAHESSKASFVFWSFDRQYLRQAKTLLELNLYAS